MAWASHWRRVFRRNPVLVREHESGKTQGFRANLVIRPFYWTHHLVFPQCAGKMMGRERSFMKEERYPGLLLLGCLAVSVVALVMMPFTLIMVWCQKRYHPKPPQHERSWGDAWLARCAWLEKTGRANDPSWSTWAEGL